jgi:hypothetical protein
MTAPRSALSQVWLAGTVALTVGSFAVTIALAPPANAQPGRALQWLLFVGSSVHVAATGWFYSVPEVRGYVWQHRQRYVYVPLALVAGTAVVAALVPPERFAVPLLAFFAWQFFHFQKQNLGMAALAGVSRGAGSVRPGERKAIVVAGCAGIVGLLAHPELLQLAVRVPDVVRWLFPVAGAVFAAGVLAGLVLLWRRPAGERPIAYVAVYLLSLLFFLPVFVFTSPYAAVAGLTVAHGYQYLLVVGLVAGAGPGGRSNLVAIAVLVNMALLGGLALNAASHLHGAGPAGRLLFGAYLGLSMAHFVVDAGLWRLRDAFPRAFLSERMPYLLLPRGRGTPEVAAGEPARS